LSNEQKYFNNHLMKINNNLYGYILIDTNNLLFFNLHELITYNNVYQIFFYYKEMVIQYIFEEYMYDWIVKILRLIK
jgi:hypothetical protein